MSSAAAGGRRGHWCDGREKDLFRLRYNLPDANPAVYDQCVARASRRAAMGRSARFATRRWRFPLLSASLLREPMGRLADSVTGFFYAQDAIGLAVLPTK